MKIACYCQHVLGIGHFHRSLAICEKLAGRHETTMILGGPKVNIPATKVNFLHLPGLRMDQNFSQLIPCSPGSDIEKIKEKRAKMLSDFFMDFRPDVFLVELYPFGRKAFRFELDPVLNGISRGISGSCLRMCSLRDILVEKKDSAKFETRATSILNSSFDALLVHADPSFIKLEKTFHSVKDISIPIYYTGFISPDRQDMVPDKNLRKKLGLTDGDKLVVASIGGGTVGGELLQSVALAASNLRDETNIHFHLFTGLYSEEGLTEDLHRHREPRIHIHNFCDNFQEWLAAADLSVSMAGYNTCMNLLRAEVPSLLYPFNQNREQRMRIEAFSETADFTLLQRKDLEDGSLAKKIMTALQRTKHPNSVDLDGASNSTELIEKVFEKTRRHGGANTNERVPIIR